MPPPKKSPSPKGKGNDLADQLREVIASRGLSSHELGQLADVHPTMILRFLSGERDITLTTAGRIAAALGLRLVEVGARKRK